MSTKVLALAGSPRRGGNTDILLERAASGVEAAGGRVERLAVAEKRITPCTACGACLGTGECTIRDEMEGLYHQLVTCQALVVATPVFFHGVPAQLKAMVDRCQALWARKERLGQVVRRVPGRALLISVGGTDYENTFTGVVLTVGLLFRVLGMKELPPVLVPGVDEKGAILSHTPALKLAERRGRELLLPRG